MKFQTRTYGSILENEHHNNSDSASQSHSNKIEIDYHWCLNTNNDISLRLEDLSNCKINKTNIYIHWNIEKYLNNFVNNFPELCCWLFIFIFVLFLYFISLDHLAHRLNFDIQFVKINIRRCISIYIMIQPTLIQNKYYRTLKLKVCANHFWFFSTDSHNINAISFLLIK